MFTIRYLAENDDGTHSVFEETNALSCQVYEAGSQIFNTDDNRATTILKELLSLNDEQLATIAIEILPILDRIYDVTHGGK